MDSKMRPWHRCFPMNFAKFLRTPFLRNTSGRLVLDIFILIDYSVILDLPEAVAQRCSVKKVFLKISQNSPENICARASFLKKLQGSGLQLY